MEEVSCILVTYNRINLLKECLAALFKQSIPLSHIYIVDNNSTDGTSEYLKTEIKGANNNCVVKCLNKNIGGAGGFEYGLKAAIKETNDQFFWIMDDDTIPNIDALKELLVAAKQLDNQFGFLCSNVHMENGEAGNIPNPSVDWSDKATEGLIKVKSATFVSFFVERKIVEKCGTPIGKLFIWGDDTEYTRRLAVEADCYFVAKSNVLHKAPLKSVNILNDVDTKIERYFYSFRNGIYIKRKFDGNRAVCIRIIKNLFLAVKVLLISKNHRIRRVKSIIKGTTAGLFFKEDV